MKFNTRVPSAAPVCKGYFCWCVWSPLLPGVEGVFVRLLGLRGNRTRVRVPSSGRGVADAACERLPAPRLTLDRQQTDSAVICAVAARSRGENKTLDHPPSSTLPAPGQQSAASDRKLIDEHEIHMDIYKPRQKNLYWREQADGRKKYLTLNISFCLFAEFIVKIGWRELECKITRKLNDNDGFFSGPGAPGLCPAPLMEKTEQSHLARF
ncbi:hypothetical protein EVAR_75770_1 [Eumeta japonica]|uniref:Uncharacterized protein n=1 Tax=Eumeta variegata TaxID=151549 RepID=A0A4C1TDW8_EUMVA|nr:hypothetical protein EVAR_75770_1 [Eumeta japonica]